MKLESFLLVEILHEKFGFTSFVVVVCLCVCEREREYVCNEKAFLSSVKQLETQHENQTHKMFRTTSQRLSKQSFLSS